MPSSLAEIMSSLSSVYDPQRQLVQQQQAALPGQQQAEQAGLDQAKTNAFSDIGDAANSKGMTYSGMPIAEQAKYTGATYLPAVANLKNTYANKGFALQSALLGINANQSKQAQGTYDAQASAEAAQAQKEADFQRQIQLEQYKAGLSNQGNMALAGMLGGGGQQQGQPDYSQSVSLADLQKYIPKDYASRFLPGYTERTAIPKLQQLYSHLDPNELKTVIYNYRKQVAGT